MTATTTTYATGYHSAHRRRRSIVLTLITVAVAAAAALSAMTFGAVHIPLPHVIGALLGTADHQTILVVGTLRLPRVVAGLVVGAALGLAGSLTQTVTRNPLASPDIIGVTSGASVGAVCVAMAAGSYGGVSGLAAMVGMPVAAAVGALTATAVVTLASRTPERVVLVGVGVTVAAQSLVAWLLTLGDAQDAARATTWLTGSLGGTGWASVVPVVAVLTATTPAILLIRRHLAVLPLGDDLTRGLGVPLARVRWTALISAAVLAAGATAAAGPVAFVGLVAPRIAARLWHSERPPGLGSAACGAALVATSDLIARNVFAVLGGGTLELPVGIVTALIGGGYLVALLTSRRISA
ncbi:putative siderophore transport system permease protein YfhA [Austwickia sp. TVS 96-490-7B]|uniref:FecCD family ABC transporter permease n=1 Tax=Austwickia sp. TVS 96-490-7B TaxID=2830843 RepID=UPI001C58B132|nr:iron chelate uptake ABC transporter family permease subunit [Austwickia sp. TVS 96-490-7B]MBW3087003.1 putative siderophore transport system permease protein YfhA [Austwickia sp. TVS 96-490-7B]